MKQFIYGRAKQGFGNIIVDKVYAINIDHIVCLDSKPRKELGGELTSYYVAHDCIATVKFADMDVDFIINESDYNVLVNMER